MVLFSCFLIVLGNVRFSQTNDLGKKHGILRISRSYDITQEPLHMLVY